MALIKCPQCGQTVLSVASVCPKCSYILLQNPTPQGEDRDFVNCRRCGKVISRAAVHCEYCGYPQRVRRLMRRGVVAVLALSLIALGGLYARGRLFDNDSRPEASPVAPVSVPPVVATVPDPEPAGPASARAEDAMVSPPGVQSELQEPEPTPPPPPARTVTRWTITWTNVREGRGIEYPVIRVLSPGDSVQVAGYALGWWRVYTGGREIGFVATDLLVDRPPIP
jgi:ribosomal protein L37E